MSDDIRFLVVWEESGSTVSVVEGDERQLDDAVSTWIDTGRDALLHLTTTEGVPYRMLASNVTSWLLSTPQSRYENERVRAVMDAERAAIRESLGIWGGEDE